MLTRSIRMPARICATLSGWIMYGSPESRCWPLWNSRANR